MDRFPFLPLLLACLLVSGALPLRAAEDNPVAMLQAFARRLPAQAKGGSEEERPSFASQIQVLSALLAHGNYERAETRIALLRVDELPVELQVEWANIESAILKRAAEAKQTQSAEWRAKVDQLVSDARATCLAATKASEVEPLLVRVTGL